MANRRGRTKKGGNSRGAKVGGLFPDKPRKTRKNAQVNFRPTDEQAAFMERAQGRGYSKSRVVITAIDLAMGFDSVLKEAEMDEFATYAKESGQSLGAAIARAARLGFAELKKQDRPKQA